MSEQPQHIICAVLGMPASRRTVTRAIDLALESGARLTFFFAVDAEFQAQAAIGSPLSIVYRQLVDMSEFAMLILQDRAERRGVAHVDWVVRQGQVRQQLLQFVATVQADLLVVGHPSPAVGRPTLKPAEFEAFVAQLEHEGNLRVELVSLAPT